MGVKEFWKEVETSGTEGRGSGGALEGSGRGLEGCGEVKEEKEGVVE